MKFGEESLQVAVANYLRYQYPNSLFLHTPNEGKKNMRQGTRLKKMVVVFNRLSNSINDFKTHIQIKNENTDF